MIPQTYMENKSNSAVSKVHSSTAPIFSNFNEHPIDIKTSTRQSTINLMQKVITDTGNNSYKWKSRVQILCQNS